MVLFLKAFTASVLYLDAVDEVLDTHNLLTVWDPISLPAHL